MNSRLFRMDDIKAHKLHRKLLIPFNIVFFIITYLIFFFLLSTVDGWDLSPLKKVLSAILIFEVALGIPLWLILSMFYWMIKKVFLFFVQPIASGKYTSEQAYEIFELGEIGILGLKLSNDAGNFSSADEFKLYSLVSWHGRLFFGEKIRKRVSEIVKNYKSSLRETGLQASDLNHVEQEKLNKIPSDLQEDFFEKAASHPTYFYSFVRIIFTIIYFF